MNEEDVVNKIIIDAEALREVWSDLDTASNEIFFIFKSKNFKISTQSCFALIDYQFSQDLDIVFDFVCRKEQTNSYSMSLMKIGQKALSQSSKVSIRLNSEGLLSIQYLFVLGDDHLAYAELFCVPNFESSKSHS